MNIKIKETKAHASNEIAEIQRHPTSGSKGEREPHFHADSVSGYPGKRISVAGLIGWEPERMVTVAVELTELEARDPSRNSAKAKFFDAARNALARPEGNR